MNQPFLGNRAKKLIRLNKIIAFVINDPYFFISHRIHIGLELIRQGYEVYIIAPGECPHILIEHGFKFLEIQMNRKGKNPLRELQTIVKLFKIFKTIKPDIVHLITIKPYLYGGVAARFARVPSVVIAVAGLGILFSQNKLKTKLLRKILFPIYHFAFSHSNQKVIFQNTFDLNQLLGWGVLEKKQAVLIRGSGTDLSEYTYSDEPDGTIVVSFAARLLRDKGVLDFVEASRILKMRNVLARFWLIGEPDPGNAYSVSFNDINSWQDSDLVEYLGFRKDIANLFSKSNIVTLPSYYGEGLPKVLIEAAACGRAVITTDHPGCRDAIEVDTGLLIPIKDATALADAIEHLIKNPEKRKSMGLAGRALAEQEFAVEKIVEQHMKIYEGLSIDRK